MLTEAIRLARDEGKHVVVWAANFAHGGQLTEMLASFSVDNVLFSAKESRLHSHVVFTIGQGRIEIRSVTTDKERRRLDFGDSGHFEVLGYRHDVTYLVDHYTLECLYPNVIRQWVRFAK
jgi:hypothetical protein